MKNIVDSAVAYELSWIKSSYSGAEGGQCVEMAVCVRTVYVRDSKDASGAVLAVSSDAWSEFVASA